MVSRIGKPRSLIDRIEPKNLFSFRWHPFAVDPNADYTDEPMTLVAFSLKEVPEGVLLTVTESGFDAAQVLSLMPRATALMGVPTYYVRLAADPRLTREATAHMRLFVSGSAPLLPETHRVFEERTGHAILERYGSRGYRAVQLEAGILGGKLYLAAYAQRLGASGLTFYDDDVVSFFSPHARGKSAIFLVALGRSALRK